MSELGDSHHGPPIGGRTYTVVSLGAGLSATGLLVGLAASDQIDKMAAVFGSWIVWLPIAVLSGTRRRWDPSFASGSRLARIRTFLKEWVGVIGVATAVCALVLWIVLSPYGIHPRGGYWLVLEIAVPVGLLAFRGAVRRIGAGLSIVLAAPLWPFLLIGALVLLGPPLLIYLATIVITALLDRIRE